MQTVLDVGAARSDALIRLKKGRIAPAPGDFQPFTLFRNLVKDYDGERGKT
jgi:hypothetical protein